MFEDYTSYFSIFRDNWFLIFLITYITAMIRKFINMWDAYFIKHLPAPPTLSQLIFF